MGIVAIFLSRRTLLRHIWLGVMLILVSLLAITIKASRTPGQGGQVAVVSAASYTSALAPDSIAAAFGSRLATRVEVASSLPLPTNLAGTTVRVNGQLAQLFFVSRDKSITSSQPVRPPGQQMSLSRRAMARSRPALCR